MGYYYIQQLSPQETALLLFLFIIMISITLSILVYEYITHKKSWRIKLGLEAPDEENEIKEE